MRNYEKIMKESERLQKTICLIVAEKKFRLQTVVKQREFFMWITNGDIFRGKTGNDISLTFVNPVTIVFWNNFAYRRK